MFYNNQILQSIVNKNTYTINLKEKEYNNKIIQNKKCLNLFNKLVQKENQKYKTSTTLKINIYHLKYQLHNHKNLFLQFLLNQKKKCNYEFLKQMNYMKIHYLKHKKLLRKFIKKQLLIFIKNMLIF
jgi:hypothetical protein